MGSIELLHESGEEAEPAICPACGGEGVSVGVLGRLKWFRWWLTAPLRREREREFERLLAAYRPPTEPELRMTEVAECPDPLPALRAFYSRRPRPWRPRMERKDGRE
jgi:hypothetical protein